MAGADSDPSPLPKFKPAHFDLGLCSSIDVIVVNKNCFPWYRRAGSFGG
jgi:hypothetical protein